jgi:hypothetical protein
MRCSVCACWVVAALLLPQVACAQEEAPVHELDSVPVPPTQATPMPLVQGVPVDLAIAPLLATAEADLAAGRRELALARAQLAAEVLPEHAPLRIRADGLRLLAAQRVGAAPAPPSDEVLVPLVAQADLDLRAAQPQLALARLELALSRLPAGSPLATRAAQLHRVAASMLGIAPPQAAPPTFFAPPPAAPPRDDGRRGVGEIVELYIMAAGLGVLTGAYLPFVISDGTASGTTYLFSMLAGGALLSVATLTLDLVARLPSGLPPTVSSSIRFGLGHGLLTSAIYASDTVGADGSTAFSLVWGGTVLGALTGFAVGAGLTPTVAEARFVESTGYWGAALGGFTAMMLTELGDATAAWATMLALMDAGLLIGAVMTGFGAIPSTRRTLFLDLGVLIGAGVGSLVPAFYYVYADQPVEAAPFGAAMLLGSLAGWIVTYLVTDGMDAARSEATPVQIGLAPREGGGALTASGTF